MKEKCDKTIKFINSLSSDLNLALPSLRKDGFVSNSRSEKPGMSEILESSAASLFPSVMVYSPC